MWKEHPDFPYGMRAPKGYKPEDTLLGPHGKPVRMAPNKQEL